MFLSSIIFTAKLILFNTEYKFLHTSFNSEIHSSILTNMNYYILKSKRKLKIMRDFIIDNHVMQPGN